jgi:hypothetical protein
MDGLGKIIMCANEGVFKGKGFGQHAAVLGVMRAVG